MPKLTIDGKEIEVEPGLTVIQACEIAGVEIPRFCYHESLSIAGNCRMCLVEMERAPKPIASCAMPVADGMAIRTDTEQVRKARNGAMEFLLINHPLDCPICDQGGECDLQDQALFYGCDRSRYTENKRTVSNKDLGPLIKTIMTRCIHCTRCVRFATEVAGVEELGATGRGEGMEIGAYVQKSLSSELSGNLIDLCPVGALTSKPYAFTARPWELRKTESIDAMDALGCNIRVDARGSEVMRILPRLNEEVNEEWISDKTRFACDGLRRQRLDRPYLRGEDGKLKEASWDQVFDAIAAQLQGLEGEKIAAIVGDQCDAESVFALRLLMQSLGSPNLECRQDGAALDPSARASYLFNSGIAGIDAADAILIVGSNPRSEAPVLNARIRRRWLHGRVAIGVIGEQTDLTYKYEYLGAGPATLADVASGEHAFAKTLKDAERPMLILGQGALARPDGAAVLALAREAADRLGMIIDGADGAADWNGFNILHVAAARVGALDIGFVPGKTGRDLAGILAGAKDGAIEMVYLLAADEFDMGGLGNAFVIYQGHHGDKGAHRADVILPGAAYTEKDGLYVNTEGRAQVGRRAGFPPGDAREDWTILRALSERLGRVLPFDTLGAVRDALAKAVPSFAAIDRRMPAEWPRGEGQNSGVKGPTGDAPFASPIANFHMTDPISRASPTMAECTKACAAAVAAE